GAAGGARSSDQRVDGDGHEEQGEVEERVVEERAGAPARRVAPEPEGQTQEPGSEGRGRGSVGRSELAPGEREQAERDEDERVEDDLPRRRTRAADDGEHRDPRGRVVAPAEGR